MQVVTPPPPPPPPPSSSYQNGGHIVNVYQPRVKSGKITTSKQIQSAVSKQIGNIGKKLKKNLGNMIANGGHGCSAGVGSRIGSGGKAGNKNPRHKSEFESSAIQKKVPQGSSVPESAADQKRLVSGAQSFILGAVILTDDNLLPYQDEMISNYLQDAKSRYDRLAHDKEKARRDKIEAAEKHQRDIYLNGGYVDCVNSGCRGQGTSETSYLCKPCFSEQKSYRTTQVWPLILLCLLLKAIPFSCDRTIEELLDASRATK